MRLGSPGFIPGFFIMETFEILLTIRIVLCQWN
jgi:hypothetical protein